MSQTKPIKAATLNPERTRERILSAALKEFAAKGFAGARVDTIARRAAINKRMLYHYFGDKEALFLEVLRRKIVERQALAEVAPEDPAEHLPFRFGKAACKDADWIRLLEWEALQGGDRKVINESERIRVTSRSVERIRRQQAAGRLSANLIRATCCWPNSLALTIYPLAFPQLTRIITGRSVFNPKLQNEYSDFLRRFAVAFQPTERRRVGKDSTKK